MSGTTRLRPFTYRFVASGGQVVTHTFYADTEADARRLAEAWAYTHDWAVDGEVE